MQWCQSRLGGRWITPATTQLFARTMQASDIRTSKTLTLLCPTASLQFRSQTHKLRAGVSIDTSVIYMLVAKDLAIPLSQQLYALINPANRACTRVSFHTRRAQMWSFCNCAPLTLFLSLSGPTYPLATMLSAYVQMGLLTKAELDGLVAAFRQALVKSSRCSLLFSIVATIRFNETASFRFGMDHLMQPSAYQIRQILFPGYSTVRAS